MPKLENQEGTMHFKELNCPLVEIAKDIHKFVKQNVISLKNF